MTANAERSVRVRGIKSGSIRLPVALAHLALIEGQLQPAVDTFHPGSFFCKTEEANFVIDKGGGVIVANKERDLLFAVFKHPAMPDGELSFMRHGEVNDSLVADSARQALSAAKTPPIWVGVDLGDGADFVRIPREGRDASNLPLCG